MGLKMVSTWWKKIKIRCVDGYKQRKNCNKKLTGNSKLSMTNFAAEMLALNRVVSRPALRAFSA